MEQATGQQIRTRLQLITATTPLLRTTEIHSAAIKRIIYYLKSKLTIYETRQNNLRTNEREGNKGQVSIRFRRPRLDKEYSYLASRAPWTSGWSIIAGELVRCI